MDGIHKSSNVSSANIAGWDIGAANVKAARLFRDSQGIPRAVTSSKPFEIWKEKDRLPQVLQEIFQDIAYHESVDAMAVTTTAELSDIFATKREGILDIFANMKECFPDIPLYALNLSGRFESLQNACLHPLDFAAANWLASAQWIAKKHPNCLIVDVGSTTTDILPILDGKVSVHGYTDLERLLSGELVYTGVLRTNLAAIVQSVPIRGYICPVASEYFAISADMHLILGHLNLPQYNCSTPDGQAPSMESARRRVARLVCADTEILSIAEIDAMAGFIYERQLNQIVEGLGQILSHMPQLHKHPVIILGLGAFLGREAAVRAGLNPLNQDKEWNLGEREVAPCIAVAHLLKESLQAQS
jgi:(4-(4-[2-(gamma-L-glutamylamino)ethyl]phenoxymethyl)furan-2-yl)methanamine synthase